MKILFLMLSCPDLNSNAGSLYSDLAAEFCPHGHDVTIITLETGTQPTRLYREGGINVLRVKTLNSQGTGSFLKKGVAYVWMPVSFKRAYKKYLAHCAFDLILASAPPVTWIDFISYVKKKTGAVFYLILRDIHPDCFQGYIRKIPGVYLFFYLKAQKAYKKADYIGCMSPANIDYVCSIAPRIEKSKVVLLPNWQKYQAFAPIDYTVREKYRLQNKFVAIYGGNLSVGQGLENIIALAKHYIDCKDIVFLIVGKGIRKQFLVNEVKKNSLSNVLFVDFMPREEYNYLMKSADAGLVSLDKNYTVPTCPSRIIGYMSMKIPVIAMINKGNDYGKYYIDRAGCGFWTDDMNNPQIYAGFDRLYRDKDCRIKKGEAGYEYYLSHFTSECIYRDIMNQINH
jgi:hypothetical protein